MVSRMEQDTLKVLIVGAGIAGTCLAWWLNKTGLHVEVTIVERATAARISGQAVDIRGPAVEIIDLMGLRDAILQHHTTEHGMKFVDSKGRTIIKFDATQNEEKQSITSEFEILRADLAEILQCGTNDQPNIKYVYGQTVTAITQTSPQVQVLLGEGCQESFDLLIAADGAMSHTRDLMFGKEVSNAAQIFLGQYVAFFSMPRISTDNRYWNWYNATKGRMLSVRPHKNDETVGAYLAITLPKRGDRMEELESALKGGWPATKQFLHDYFREAGWQAARLLSALDQAKDFYMCPINVSRLSQWSIGHAVVLGDAASATVGMGTSLAITEAYVLAGELSRIKDKSDIPDALQRFEAKVEPLVTRAQDLPAAYPQLTCPQSWGLWVMKVILHVIATLHMQKPFMKILGGDNDWKFWQLPEYTWHHLPNNATESK